MARISKAVLMNSIVAVSAMSTSAKLELADELFLKQPSLLGAVLVQKSLGVSTPKIDFLLGLILVMFTAMRESGINWPRISEDEIDRQMRRTTGFGIFAQGLTPELFSRVAEDHAKAHPEKDLLAYVMGSLRTWLERVNSEESDKYVMLAAINTVNCLAYCDLKHQEFSAASAAQKAN